MAKDLAPIPRFPLPEEWEPEGTRCVIVRIPDDAQYLATLTGLLDLLKWSDNFARDDTKTGAAIVCRTWQSALEMQPITWGDCEQMILRQNPDDPCQLQQSSDGGETWTLAFDYSLCSNVITVPAPYPDSETGASDAAAAAIRNVFQGLLGLVDCEAGRAAYIAAATAYLRAYDATYANPIALGAIFDAFCALDETEQDYYLSDCPYDEHKSDLEDCADPSGLFDWLNCASEAIFDWLNDTSDDLMNALNQAAAALSGNGWQLASQGGAGGGASFGSECSGWTVTFDDGSYPYTLIYGTVVSGGNPGNCALDATTNIPGAGWHEVVRIKIEPPVGLLNTLRADLKTETYPGYLIGVSGSWFDVDDTILDSFSLTPAAMPDWTTYDILTVVGWNITAGQYIRFDLAVYTAGADVVIDATHLHIDNIHGDA